MIQALRDLLAALIEHQREEARLKRCERRYWMWSLRLTFVAIVVAALAFGASALQARYAQVQAQYAQQQLIDQRDESRPWIKVTAAVGGDFAYSPISGSEVKINVTLTNVGKTPAFDVTITALAEPQTWFSVAEPETVLALCNNNPTYFPFNALVFFPDDPTTIVETVFVKDHPYIGDKGGVERSFDNAPLFVYGCVHYSYGKSPTIHHSGFIYVLGRKPDPAGGINPGPLPVYARTLQTVHKADLELTPYPGEGALIN